MNSTAVREDVAIIQRTLAQMENAYKFPKGIQTPEALYICRRLKDLAGDMATLIDVHDIDKEANKWENMAKEH